MAEREETIVIRAKNLSKEGYDDAKKSAQSFKGEVDVIGQQLSGVGSIATKLAATFGVTFSIGALVSFANATIDFASNLDDLSKATSISTDKLQELGFAGKRVGIDLDSIATLVGQLSKRIATGDSSAVSAVQSLGLSLKDLRALSPDELFVTLVEAVSKIEDPLAQAGIGSELFGKQYQAAMKMANDGIRETMAQAKDFNAVLSKEAIQTLDSFGDKLGDVTLQLKVMGAQALTPIVDFFNVTASLARKSPTFIDPKAEAEFKKFGAAVGGASTSLEGLGFNLQLSDAVMKQLSAGTKDTISSTDLINNRIKALREEALQPLSDVQKSQILELASWGQGEKEIATLIGSSEAAVHRYIAAHKEHEEELKKLTAANEKFQASITKLNTSTLGFVSNWGMFTGQLPQSTSLIEEARAEMDLLESSTNEFHHGITVAGDEMATVTIPAFAELPNVVAKSTEAIKDASKNVGGFGASLKGLITGLTGGGGIGGFFQNLGGGFVQGLGKMLSGGIMGLMTGGLDLAVKGIGALFGKLFGPSELDKTRKALGEFIKGEGGLEALTAKAKDAGLSLDKLYAARTQTGLKAAIDELNAGIAKHKQLLADAAVGFDALTGAAAAFGGSVPAAIQPMLEALLQSKNLTVEQRAALSELAAGGQTDYAALTEMASKYGLSLADLGPKFQQANLDKLAFQYSDDFRKLAEAGANTDAVIRKMGPSIQELIDQSAEFGGSVPESMRPLLQRMVDLGLLVDTSGEKFSDLSSFNFNDNKSPLDQATDKLTKAIEKLAEILGDLPAVAGDAAGGITHELNGVKINPIHVPIVFDVPDVPQMAAGGEGVVTKPTLFLAGEAGPERFWFSGANKTQVPAGSSSSGGGNPDVLAALERIDRSLQNQSEIVIHHQTVLDGRVVDERVQRIAAEGRLAIPRRAVVQRGS